MKDNYPAEDYYSYNSSSLWNSHLFTQLLMPDIPEIWLSHILLLLANHFRSWGQFTTKGLRRIHLPATRLKTQWTAYLSVCACPACVFEYPFANVEPTLQSYFCFLSVSLCVTPALFFSNKMKKISRPASATQVFKVSLNCKGVQGQPQLHRCSRPASATQIFMKFEFNIDETQEKNKKQKQRTLL